MHHNLGWGLKTVSLLWQVMFGSYTEKWAVEHAAHRVCGVKALAIEMDVKLSESDKLNDVDIACAARNFFSG